VTPSSARALRRRRVAELRAAEPGLSLRQMADRLGVSRDTVTRDLAEIDRGAAESAPPAGRPEPVAEQTTAAERAGLAPVADPAPQVSEGGRTGDAMPGEASAHPVAQDRPPAQLPRRVSAERLEIDLRRRPGMRRDLAVLADLGLGHEDLIDFALQVLATGYRQGLADGVIRPGLFKVLGMKVAPLLPDQFGPRKPHPAPAGGS
jgi:DNA-binding transcriptional MocR family regulator